MLCPACNGRSVGRVGTEYYYCWDCCSEFSRTGDGYQVFTLGVDGDRIAIPPADPATPELTLMTAGPQ